MSVKDPILAQNFCPILCSILLFLTCKLKHLFFLILIRLLIKDSSSNFVVLVIYKHVISSVIIQMVFVTKSLPQNEMLSLKIKRGDCYCHPIYKMLNTCSILFYLIYVTPCIYVCVGDNNRTSAANGWSTENTPNSSTPILRGLGGGIYLNLYILFNL